MSAIAITARASEGLRVSDVSITDNLGPLGIVILAIAGVAKLFIKSSSDVEMKRMSLQQDMVTQLLQRVRNLEDALIADLAERAALIAERDEAVEENEKTQKKHSALQQTHATTRRLLQESQELVRTLTKQMKNLEADVKALRDELTKRKDAP